WRRAIVVDVTVLSRRATLTESLSRVDPASLCVWHTGRRERFAGAGGCASELFVFAELYAARTGSARYVRKRIQGAVFVRGIERFSDFIDRPADSSKARASSTLIHPLLLNTSTECSANNRARQPDGKRSTIASITRSFMAGLGSRDAAITTSLACSAYLATS